MVLLRLINMTKFESTKQMEEMLEVYIEALTEELTRINYWSLTPEEKGNSFRKVIKQMNVSKEEKK